MANLVSFLASKLYDLGEWFHYHSPFFKLTKRIDNNLDNREDYDVDNRDVNDKYDAKTTFFHTNVFHLGIIVVSLQH